MQGRSQDRIRETLNLVAGPPDPLDHKDPSWRELIGALRLGISAQRALEKDLADLARRNEEYLERLPNVDARRRFTRKVGVQSSTLGRAS